MIPYTDGFPFFTGSSLSHSPPLFLPFPYTQTLKKPSRLMGDLRDKLFHFLVFTISREKKPEQRCSSSDCLHTAFPNKAAQCLMVHRSYINREIQSHLVKSYKCMTFPVILYYIYTRASWSSWQRSLSGIVIWLSIACQLIFTNMFSHFKGRCSYKICQYKEFKGTTSTSLRAGHGLTICFPYTF